MNSYKKLFDNVIIFSFGVLSSKIISFVLVPLYTYYLTQTEYGTADLIMTTASMLLPLVTVSMYEAVIRFVMNKSYNQDVLMSNIYFLVLSGYLFFLLCYPLFRLFNVFEGQLIYLYLLIFIQGLNSVLAQFSRGIGNSKVFAINGILTTLFSGVLNIIFIVLLDYGIVGYLISFILAYVLSTLYLIYAVKPFNGVRKKYIDSKILMHLINYSLPLIPNNLMWWLTNSSSRFFINWFVGIEANGIFAVASKIPTLINVISQVFTQAWQISAFEVYDEKKNDSFYSNVLDLYFSILLISSSFIIIFLKPLFLSVFDDAYYNSWVPVPFLILGTVFSAISGFLGVAYTASKKTSGVFTTSIYGGGLSVIFNLILIPTLGIVGAGISSMISFFALFLIRYRDTRKLIEVTVNWKKVMFSLLIIFIQILFLFANVNLRLELIINVTLLLGLIMLNKNMVSIAIKLFNKLLLKFR